MFAYNLTKEYSRVYSHLIQEYQKIQDKLSLKIPYCTNFKLAKILNSNTKSLEDPSTIVYYYDGLNGEYVKLVMKSEESQEGFTNDFKLEQQDVLVAKQVLQCLIETFHWSANFGQYLDPFKENLIYDKEYDLFLFKPTFKLITQYLFLDKFEFSWERLYNFRQSVYQNATHIFFCEFLDKFFQFLKELDEDKQFYKQKFQDYRLKIDKIEELYQLNEKYTGVDSLYGEDQVRKKQWRYSFKQSMILYQLDTNKKLRDQFLERKREDQKEIRNNNQQQLIQIQSDNLIRFLRSLQDIEGVSHDVLTSFGFKMKQYLNSREDYKTQINKVAAAFRPNYCPILTKNKMIDLAQLQQQQGRQQEKQKIEAAQQQQQQPQQQPQQQQQYQQLYQQQQSQQSQQAKQQDKQKIDYDQNNGLFDFIWQSNISQLNIIAQYIPKNGNDVLCSMKSGVDGKQLILRYKLELLELKNCYIVKTVIPEIMFTIETADDIMFLINVIQKEQGQTNLYVDDNRRLMLYSSIVMGQKVEIVSAIVKIIDIHQIYFYLILEFYAKNISQGRSVKELKYQHFVRELIQYVQDYEDDFENQMKNIMQENIQIGF